MSSYKTLALVNFLIILAFLNLNPWILPDSSPAIGNIAWDKIDHLIAYCILSLLLMSVYSFHKRRSTVAFMVLLTSFATGLFFEYCQLWFTSTRQFSYYDVMANVFGAVLGVTLYGVLLLYTKKCAK